MRTQTPIDGPRRAQFRAVAIPGEALAIDPGSIKGRIARPARRSYQPSSHEKRTRNALSSMIGLCFPTLSTGARTGAR